MSRFIYEIKSLVEQGGIVLWLMLGLSIILYTVLSTSWLGILKVKSEISHLQNELDVIETPQLMRDRIELFELDQLAWVQRRLPVLSVLITLAPLAGLLGSSPFPLPFSSPYLRVNFSTSRGSSSSARHGTSSLELSTPFHES